MNLILNKWRAAFLILLLVFSASYSRALTVDELRADAKLTPESLIRRFSSFKFKLFDAVQPRNVFLSTQTGDCDDFATLAADVLREKGYSTHLIAVFMEKEVHVVCYIKGVGAYLDYNNRKKASPLVPTNGSLSDIATKVAQSFNDPWSSVLEYTLKNGIQQTVATDFPQKTNESCAP
jgi:hypothetical protein